MEATLLLKKTIRCNIIFSSSKGGCFLRHSSPLKTETSNLTFMGVKLGVIRLIY